LRGRAPPISHYCDAVRFGDLSFISGLVATVFARPKASAMRLRTRREISYRHADPTTLFSGSLLAASGPTHCGMPMPERCKNTIEKPSPADFDATPEWTAAEDFARAKPFKEVFPEQFEAWKRMGRPPVAAPKVHIGFRLAADVVAGIRATGKGYNARVEKVLREALAKGEL
jgi:uncharacterized protein (DUF4415 family)